MLEELARELGLRNTTFTGQVSNAEMPTLYDQSDIYLNSSEIDNMPLSIPGSLRLRDTCGDHRPRRHSVSCLSTEQTGLLVPAARPRNTGQGRQCDCLMNLS